MANTVTRQQQNVVLAFLREGHQTRQLKAPATRPKRRGLRILLAIIRKRR